MRIAFALVIAYCFGCVLSDDFDEERDDIEILKKYYFTPDRPTSVLELRKRRAFQAQKRSRRHVNTKKLHGRLHSHHARKFSAVDNRMSSNIARHRASHPHRKIKATVVEKGEESHVDEQGDEFMDWDDWSDWTKCSVTCGNGRRVRWRHCSSEKCPIKGLKRAQMKACHLEDCPTKGLLTWLGIKS